MVERMSEIKKTVFCLMEARFESARPTTHRTSKYPNLLITTSRTCLLWFLGLTSQLPLSFALLPSLLSPFLFSFLKGGGS